MALCGAFEVEMKGDYAKKHTTEPPKYSSGEVSPDLYEG